MADKQLANKQEVVDYYDEYTGRQARVGINLRHIHILRSLKKHGLKPHHRVLEIGCGIGTVTELLAQYLKEGSILGADISPKSIETAQTHLAHHKNASFLVTDMSDMQQPTLFDVVVLPDVLEHIPIEQHRNLFRVIRANIKPDGFVFINIPDPRFLEWMHQYAPEKLQVIDQPIHADILVGNVYPNDFYIEKLESYSIFYQEHDYQRIVLRPNKPLAPKTHVFSRYAQRIRTILGRSLG